MYLTGLDVHYLIDVTLDFLTHQRNYDVNENRVHCHLTLNYTFEVAAVTSAGAGMSAVLTVTPDHAG
jgi:hypothetical protein